MGCSIIEKYTGNIFTIIDIVLLFVYMNGTLYIHMLLKIQVLK